jgi:hypothetical protein
MEEIALQTNSCALKWILKKWGVVMLTSSDSRLEPVVIFCKHGNESLHFIKEQVS